MTAFYVYNFHAYRLRNLHAGHEWFRPASWLQVQVACVVFLLRLHTGSRAIASLSKVASVLPALKET